MTNYSKLIKNINEATSGNGREHDDIWLLEDTVNNIVAEATKVSFEDANVVMTFENGEYVSISNSGHLIGGEDRDAFWVVIHAGKYNRSKYQSTGSKGASIL